MTLGWLWDDFGMTLGWLWDDFGMTLGWHLDVNCRFSKCNERIWVNIICSTTGLICQVISTHHVTWLSCFTNKNVLKSVLDLNFRLVIQCKVQLWPVIKKASKLFFSYLPPKLSTESPKIAKFCFLKPFFRAQCWLNLSEKKSSGKC